MSSAKFNKLFRSLAMNANNRKVESIGGGGITALTWDSANYRYVVTDAGGNTNGSSAQTFGEEIILSGTNSGKIHFREAGGGNYVTLRAPTSFSVNQDYILPSDYPSSSGYALVSTDAGVMSWAAFSGGNTYITALTWDTPNSRYKATLSDSTIVTGSELTAFGPQIRLSGTNAGQVDLYEAAANGTAYVSLRAPTDMGTDPSYILTLPTTDGGSGQYMISNGSGVLSWATPTDANYYTSSATFGTDGILTGTIAGGGSNWTGDFNAGLTMSNSSSNLPKISMTNTNADNSSPLFDFIKDSASPAASDDLGGIRFYGDDSGGAQHNFARIDAESPVVTAGSEVGSIKFRTTDGGTDNAGVMILSGSNVGIGRINPESKLHIDGGAYLAQFSRGTGDFTLIQSNNTNNLIFASGTPSSNTEMMTIDSTGVGIGTTSPDEKLHVLGNAEISGYISLGGSVFHDGDTDTYMGFTGNDTIEMQTGGGSRLSLNNAGMLLGGANARVTTILDEDNMSSNSATALATQQSIKAYVDASGGGGTIGGSVSDTYIPIATAADTLGNFMPAYVENTNMILGVTPASITTDADGNTAYGHLAGQSMTTGDNNVLVGYRAGISLTTGVANVFLGASAGYAATTSSYNNFIGYNAGSVGTRGNQNVGMGYYAMATNQGANNVAIGHNTMEGEVGADNDATVAIGAYALRNISGTADMNTAVGYGAMQGASTGLTDAAQYNTAVGHSSMGGLTSGYGNVAMGRNALISLTAGQINTALGYHAMYTATTTTGAVAIGYNAAGGAATANYDVAIGYEAHSAGTSSGVFIGLQAGKALAGAGTFIGKEAGESATEQYAVLIGEEAGKNSATNHSVAIGHGAAATADATKSQFMGSYAGGTWSGNNSTVIGYQAGYSGTNTTQTDNIAIGYQSMLGGNYSVSNLSNVAMGVAALKFASGSSYNVAVGYGAMFAADQTSTQTVAVGYKALSGATSADATVAIGHLAGQATTTGDNNVYIGKSAAVANTTQGNNVAVGGESMGAAGSHASTAVGYFAMNAASSQNSVALGAYALRTGSAHYNVAVGMSAMTKVSGGAGGVAVGYQSGYHPTGNYNVFIGYNTGFGTAAGGAGQNVGVGRESLMNINDGTNNVAVGYHSGKVLTDGTGSTFIGYQAGESVTTGDDNVFVGNQAGKNTTGQYNVMVGKGAGGANTSANGQVFIGNNAAASNQTGAENVVIGFQAAYSNVSSDQNTIIGYNAAQNMTAGYNTMIGHNAGFDMTTGDYNVLMGVSAGANITGSQQNVIIGAYAGRMLQASKRLIAIGYEAAYMSPSGYQVAIGYGALHSPTTSDENIAIGTDALRGASSSTAQYNIAIGNYALDAVTNAGHNIAIGRESLSSNTTGDTNVVVGYQAGYTNTDGNDNTLIGHKAGKTINGGTGRNVMVGSMAGQSATTTDSSTIVGWQAAGGAILTGDYNTAVGYQAGYALVGGVEGSVLLGHRAGYGATSGGYNTFLGYAAGQNVTTGAGNVAIGKNAGPSSTNTDSNKLYINNAAGTPLIGGDFSAGTVTITGDLIMPSGNKVQFEDSNRYLYQNGDHLWINNTETDGRIIMQAKTQYNWYVDGQNHANLSGTSSAGTGMFGINVQNNSIYGIAMASGTSKLSFDNTTANAIYRGAGVSFWDSTESYRLQGNTTSGYLQLDMNKIQLVRNPSSAASSVLQIGDSTTYDQFSIVEDARGSSATNGYIKLRAKKTGNDGYAKISLGAISGSTTSELLIDSISANEALRFDTNSKSHAFDIAKAGYVSVGGAVDSTNQFTVVGTTHLSGAATVTGVLSATAKSFNIPHPLYKDKRLVHGSLEGPEHGIYIRGTIEAIEGCEIELPEYWSAMCEDYTVQLTPHGPYTVFIREKQKDKVMVGCSSKNYKFDYYIVGSRTDETLEVVQDA